MWGRKEEPGAPPSPAPRAEVEKAPAPVAAPPAVSPPVAAPAPRPSNPGPAGAAQIGKSLRVKGEIAGSEDLYIDGEVEGKITLQGNNLTIGPNGNVRAEVSAHSITILGRLEGNVRAADRVEIRRTGSLEGDLVTARIAIEEDAVFRGSIDIVKPGVKPAEPGPRSGNAGDPAEKAKAATKSSASA
jgi:cytoskeletal protein CcmA (bactofilin family)